MGRGGRGGEEEAIRSLNDAVVQITSLWLETSYSWRGGWPQVASGKFRLEIRKNLAERVVRHWNTLPYGGVTISRGVQDVWMWH